MDEILEKVSGGEGVISLIMLHFYLYIKAMFEQKTMPKRANIDVSSEIATFCFQKGGGDVWNFSEYWDQRLPLVNY